MGRLLGGGSGLTSPLGSVLNQMYSEILSYYAAQDIYPEVLAAQKFGKGIISLCIVEYR